LQQYYKLKITGYWPAELQAFETAEGRRLTIAYFYWPKAGSLLQAFHRN
jgi:hypothetical protein